MLAPKIIITALCALGLYASVFMFRKARLAQAGGLAEPSVVQQPAARLFAGLPNALLGIFYYLALGVLIWLAPRLCAAFFAASALAALTSAYLAYSLLFRTRMPCPFCWTSHGINWMLVLLVAVECKFL
ncbi:MAG: vitamin K epoxide reductase family protein [Candidatus Baltobacteraceae bacterium]